MSKSSFRCSGFQIEISIMKSVSEHQCERFLIYDHDDLSNLDIEINFLKKIIFGCFFSSKFLNKLCIKIHQKTCEKKSKNSSKIKLFFQIRQHLKNIFRTWAFISQKRFLKILSLDIDFCIFKKKLEFHLFKRNLQLAHTLLKN